MIFTGASFICYPAKKFCLISAVLWSGQSQFFAGFLSPFDLGWRIHQVDINRGVRTPPNEHPVYDNKQFDDEAPRMQELWGMQSISSLPLLPVPIWPGAVAPDRVLSVGKIEQTVSKQMTGVKLCLSYCNTWNHLTVSKKRAQACLRMSSTKCVYKSHIYLIYMYKQD